MMCPLCGLKSEVKDNRPKRLEPFKGVPRRTRACSNGHRFNTLEVVEHSINEARGKQLLEVKKYRQIQAIVTGAA